MASYPRMLITAISDSGAIPFPAVYINPVCPSPASISITGVDAASRGVRSPALYTDSFHLPDRPAQYIKSFSCQISPLPSHQVLQRFHKGSGTATLSRKSCFDEHPASLFPLIFCNAFFIQIISVDIIGDHYRKILHLKSHYGLRPQILVCDYLRLFYPL